ncbi:baseplate multidomain protein megatron [Thalassovita taeanensis]|uniref:Putative phage tail protein n=1 Tax=Thalassovita taeanensis TaxID=657014 RepID=A0A1H9HP97_9RHOB|nr:glycoside hydrolase/phage tail family protein [Thalassovita taeanensis]SEQ64169.1 Putative phage tail protein [Thalassovita taeanensis]
MATILLSAAGAALGGSVGGTVLGLSMATAGRFAGASMGRVIDQRLLGQGSDAIETGRVDRFRLTGAGEGEAVSRVFGRMRVGGQVIWASHFEEHTQKSGGGKGAAPRPTTQEYSYSVSLAVALCEGEISGVGRIWADGSEVSAVDLNLRVYPGSRTQLPDPKIEAVEGAGQVPAYRGTAYAVLEDLDLSQFGNRVPQFTFEVMRPDFEYDGGADEEPAHAIRGVALMPGTGEYALATDPAVFDFGLGASRTANVNSPSGKTDFETSLDQLTQELPNCGATSLIVSWFGDDLRCGNCAVQPKVEQAEHDAEDMPWQVAGVSREQALIVPAADGRPVYGGTPSDISVVQAITRLNDLGQKVMFYPFLLMEQVAGNTLTDPWTGEEGQPFLPWRGRITGALAPGLEGSSDGTAMAEAEVAAFFGTVRAADFAIAEGQVTYSGPDEWSYGRFILHCAALCVAAGGVDAFCIGSEMRGLTQLRGAEGGFPAVAQLRQLAAEVRSLLGAQTRIGYAADWTEYFGYQPQDGSGDVYFHLDPLWADPEIDFIGIDNYMPLSDWRDGEAHADAEWGAIYNLDYLRANIEGGEGYEWYYHSQEAELAQIRTAISDGAYDEPWVYRYKDIRGWWSNPHHERIGGVRAADATNWVPGSKPIWFTELGCAAVDKGTNQPNKFLDPKSSESSLPKYSTGRRDELIQMQYLRAMYGYWGAPENNPVSEEYGGAMIDMSHSFVWAWDARPYPFFPSNAELWSDGENYPKGHWLSGRGSGRSLASVVTEICRLGGVRDIETTQLFGYVRGYVVADVSDARSALQPLMLRYGFDAIERDGVLVFRTRNGKANWTLSADAFASTDELSGTVEATRAGESDLAGRVRLRFVQADGDYDTVAEEAVLPDEATHAVSSSEVPLVMTRGEGRQVVERWLSEARIARDSVKFALPPSALNVGAGDVLSIEDGGTKGLFRVDRAEIGTSQLIEAVRIDTESYRPVDMEEDTATMRAFSSPVPVFPLFMDLPMLSGDEVPYAPHLAATADPWPGSVAIYGAPQDANYELLGTTTARATIGQTETVLLRADPGRYDRGDALQVRLAHGSVESIGEEALLAGGNLAAIGDGTPENWELIQFQMAELIDTDTYLLSGRLRGQRGSEANMPDAWPAGSYFVLLDGVPKQLDLASSTRGLARHYRVGAARRGYDDPSYKHFALAFSGVGLKPYAPVHMKALRDVGGDLALSWVRRTRVDGDSWDALEVPLGEESEAYLVRVLSAGQVVREISVSNPEWMYSAAEQALDGVEAPFEVSVAQVSAPYGAGYFGALTITA